MKIKTALVTGGAGFIGSHMVDCLIQSGFKVRAVDNLICGREENIIHLNKEPNFEFELDDINNIKKESFYKNCDYVFHFAGIGDIVPSINNPYNYLNTNVLGTVNILERVRGNNLIKFVYAASSSCYGIANTPTNEEHQIDPIYPYALSKYQGEQCALHWSKVYNIPVNSIRIFNAYGTRVKTSGAYGAVFGVFLKQKIENKPYTLVGDGSQKRDFLYVTDVANAFLKVALSNENREIFNLGAGNPQSIRYLVDLLGGKCVYLPKRPGEPDITWANIQKITKKTGWKQQVSFENGVKKMIENIDYWKDAPLWDKESIDIATKDWFKYLKNEH